MPQISRFTGFDVAHTMDVDDRRLDYSRVGPKLQLEAFIAGDKHSMEACYCSYLEVPIRIASFAEVV